MSNTPSKAEIEKLAAEHLKAFSQFPMGGQVWFEGEVEFARAVLAKWGTPTAGEPVAYRHMHDDGWEYYDAPTGSDCPGCEALCKCTQPVVREPLTDEQLAEMMRDTWGCASIAPRHALEFARAVERAHGITQKGGRHE